MPAAQMAGVALAQEYGYNVVLEDVQMRYSEDSDDEMRECSDDELEEVAGGAMSNAQKKKMNRNLRGW